jgi:DNA-binding NarL/FixJ family response regulator
MTTRQVAPPREVVTFLASLTRQEERVLRAGTDDQSVQRIAATLILSEETIKSHRKRILKKWLLATGAETGGHTTYRRMTRTVLPWLPEPPVSTLPPG